MVLATCGRVERRSFISLELLINKIIMSSKKGNRQRQGRWGRREESERERQRERRRTESER